MGNKNTTKSPEEDEKQKRSEQKGFFLYDEKELESFFEKAKQSKPESGIERLPKNLLCLITSYLEPKCLSRASRINKFFLNLIMCSENSNMIWKGLIGRKISEEFGITEIENYLGNLELRDYEQKLNRYLLFFKHCFDMKFDTNFKGPSINVLENQLTVYTENNVKNSWNSILGDKSMSKGIHYVDITTNQLSNHFMYFVLFFFSFLIFLFLIFFSFFLAIRVFAPSPLLLTAVYIF